MPLLCALGWHKASPFPRWDNGFYFSKCDRCGRELVRSDRGGWAPLAAGGPAASHRKRVPPVALILAALLALAAAAALLRNSGPPAPEAEPAQPATRAAPLAKAVAREGLRPGGRASQVTASILNCRTGPSEEAPVIRRMKRGAPVLVLARRPGWAGISHGQKRCWVRSIHIGPAEAGVPEQGERAFLEPTVPPNSRSVA